MKKVVNVSKKAIVGSLASVAVTSVGFGAGQMLLSKVNKPVGDVVGLGAGIVLSTSENPYIKAGGAGLAAVSAFRLANRLATPKDGAAPNKVQELLGKFVPNLQGLGELGELGYAIGTPDYGYEDAQVLPLEGFGNVEESFAQVEGVEESLLGLGLGAEEAASYLS